MGTCPSVLSGSDVDTHGAQRQGWEGMNLLDKAQWPLPVRLLPCRRPSLPRGRPCQSCRKASRGHAALPIVQGQPRRPELTSRKPLVTRGTVGRGGHMCNSQTGFLVNYFLIPIFPLLEGEVRKAGFCVG